jgi:hypothetical protein
LKRLCPTRRWSVCWGLGSAESPRWRDIAIQAAHRENSQNSKAKRQIFKETTPDSGIHLEISELIPYFQGGMISRQLKNLEEPDGKISAVEIKRTLSPKVTPGLIESMETLRADRGFIVIPQGDSYPLSKTVTAIGLADYLQTIP